MAQEPPGNKNRLTLLTLITLIVVPVLVAVIAAGGSIISAIITSKSSSPSVVIVTPTETPIFRGTSAPTFPSTIATLLPTTVPIQPTQQPSLSNSGSALFDVSPILILAFVAIVGIIAILVVLRKNRLFSTGVIKYGDTIVLRHDGTKRWLYLDGEKSQVSLTSSQRLVTTSKTLEPQFNYWRVIGPYGEAKGYKNRQSVQVHDVIRLEHVYSHLRLHSHGLPARSPLSRQQEVTAFGNADENDNWAVEPEDKTAKVWRVKAKIRLIHVPTFHPLHSHQEYEGEVTCFEAERDSNDLWSTEKVRL